LVTSGLMGTGQFCTNPGLILLIDGDDSRRLAHHVAQRYRDAPVGTLLSDTVTHALSQGIEAWKNGGAELLAGGTIPSRGGCCHANTVAQVTGARFLEHPHPLQTEAFGNAVLFVVCRDVDQVAACLRQLDGNLTGSIYSDRGGADDCAYEALGYLLRRKVGRLLNDKMPTGVAVSSAMNHGGPYPATGHPGFTAVGIPASLLRFAALQCYDNVRPARLPDYLGDQSPDGMWRCVDGDWQLGSNPNC
jgi:2,5-dioxopentanoate dehydrogenase